MTPLERLPCRISRVHSVDLELPEPFVEFARRFTATSGAVALVSGTSSDCARHNLLAIRPWLTLRANLSSLSIDYQGDHVVVDGDPLGVLQQLMRRFALDSPLQPHPIAAGLVGYLSYDLKDCLEVLPRTSVDDLRLPHLYMIAPSILVVEDRVEQRTRAYLPCLDGDEADVSVRWAEFEQALALPSAPPADTGFRVGRFTSGFSRERYMAAVEAIRDYIVRGHVYQVNMSQRFRATFDGDPYALFVRLFARNPAAFFAYINAGDHQIVSTSPERFVCLDQRRVETRPIKGTRPRGEDPDKDRLLREELETSLKDDAELSMIVDLLRNDIGKVCQAGSVRVTEHKRVETYENVHHLVSIVQGRLDDGMDSVDLIRATFPGGSITGCPKIRSMEVIDELEPVRRHIYTGSIGYLSFHDTMDLSIAIRTATITGGNILFSVGGGVVYDSDPASEFEETLHKGRTLRTALDAPGSDSPQHERIAWYNGVFGPQRSLSIPVDHEGFAYGYGIFETIRVERGEPCLLAAHLERFNRSWQHCFGSSPPDITWDQVIAEVITRNHLSDTTAAIKLIAAAGARGSGLQDQTLLVTARKHVHRLHGTGRTGLRLVVYPHRRHSELCDHKTMNYMFYRMAADWAKQQGADEAIILNVDGSVSETNTANLFCVKAGKFYCPASEHVLPGTMQEAVCALLTSWGNAVECTKLTVEELKQADYVFVTNALMGAVAVARIEERSIDEGDGELMRRINAGCWGIQ